MFAMSRSEVQTHRHFVCCSKVGCGGWGREAICYVTVLQYYNMVLDCNMICHVDV